MRRPPSVQPPQCVAQRTVELRKGRTLEIRALGDIGSGVDCWLRVRIEDRVLAQFFLRADRLRAVSEALDSLAAELGVAPGVAP